MKMFMWWKQGISVSKVLSEFVVNSCVKGKMTGLLRHHCSATLPPRFASVFVCNSRLAQLQLRCLLHTGMCACTWYVHVYVWICAQGVLLVKGTGFWLWRTLFGGMVLTQTVCIQSACYTVEEGRESGNAEGWRERERSMLRFFLY